MIAVMGLKENSRIFPCFWVFQPNSRRFPDLEVPRGKFQVFKEFKVLWEPYVWHYSRYLSKVLGRLTNFWKLEALQKKFVALKTILIVRISKKLCKMHKIRFQRSCSHRKRGRYTEHLVYIYRMPALRGACMYIRRRS